MDAAAQHGGKECSAQDSSFWEALEQAATGAKSREMPTLLGQSLVAIASVDLSRVFKAGQPPESRVRTCSMRRSRLTEPKIVARVDTQVDGCTSAW